MSEPESIKAITNGAEFMKAMGVTSLTATFPGTTTRVDMTIDGDDVKVEVSDWRSRLRKQAKP